MIGHSRSFCVVNYWRSSNDKRGLISTLRIYFMFADKIKNQLRPLSRLNTIDINNYLRRFIPLSSAVQQKNKTNKISWLWTSAVCFTYDQLSLITLRSLRVAQLALLHACGTAPRHLWLWDFGSWVVVWNKNQFYRDFENLFYFFLHPKII